VGRAYGRSLIFIASLMALALLIDKVHAPASTAYHQYVYVCALAAGRSFRTHTTMRLFPSPTAIHLAPSSSSSPQPPPPGLQNSLTTKYSGNTIRTTHLTGATTDLGIALGHLIRG
jgi:hypothetical protein